MTRAEFIQRAALTLCGQPTNITPKEWVEGCERLAHEVGKLAPFDNPEPLGLMARPALDRIAEALDRIAEATEELAPTVWPDDHGHR